jgi:hypothetical protein
LDAILFPQLHLGSAETQTQNQSDQKFRILSLLWDFFFGQDLTSEPRPTACICCYPRKRSETSRARQILTKYPCSYFEGMDSQMPPRLSRRQIVRYCTFAPAVIDLGLEYHGSHIVDQCLTVSDTILPAILCSHQHIIISQRAHWAQPAEELSAPAHGA